MRDNLPGRTVAPKGKEDASKMFSRLVEKIKKGGKHSRSSKNLGDR